MVNIFCVFQVILDALFLYFLYRVQRHLPVNGITKADVSDIKKMRDAGTPIVEIAKKWNLSREEIFKLLHN